VHRPRPGPATEPVGIGTSSDPFTSTTTFCNGSGTSNSILLTALGITAIVMFVLPVITAIYLARRAVQP
jgi:hypothetical protein